MQAGLLVAAAFAVFTMLAGGAPYRRNHGSSGFFLGTGALGAFSLLLTTAATNFSAFTVLGLSGAGFRMGYVFYPVMALGTGFMALGLYVVGVPALRSGRSRGWVTPVDCMRDRYGVPWLDRLYALCLVLFTMPYLALQPMAAGMILESAAGIPHAVGVVAVTVIICLYTVTGGMRAVVRTDVFHGLLFALLVLAAWFVVAESLGGPAAAQARVFAERPWLFARPGGAASAAAAGGGANPSTAGSPGLSFPAWAGYFLLWFLADPVFPQLGQRLLAVRHPRSLERTIVAYPVVTAVLFFVTVSTGVLAAAVIPGLPDSMADRVWPIVVTSLVSPLIASIMLLAPLAALMTTMDSQLLTLSSILVRDIAGRRGESVRLPRLAVVLLSAAGGVLALYPPGDILAFLNRTAFLGYAALAPALFSCLYLRSAGPRTVAAGIVAGEATVFALGAGLVRFPGLPDIVPVALAGWGVTAAGILAGRLSRRTGDAFPGGIAPQGEGIPVHFEPLRIREVLPLRWAIAFFATPALLMDFWNWGREPTIVAGLPGWVWRTFAASIALSLLFYLFFRRRAASMHHEASTSGAEDARSCGTGRDDRAQGDGDSGRAGLATK